MAGIADGFIAGAELGSRIRDNRKRQELMEKQLEREAQGMEARMALQKEMQDKQLFADASRRSADDAIRNRELDLKAREIDMIDKDPTRALARLKAEREMQAMQGGQTPRPTAKVQRTMGDVTASYDVPVDELEQRFPQKAAPTPAAQVTQEAGGVKASFSVPVHEARRTVAAAAYKSPYGDRVADLDAKISEHEAELGAGDERSGFLGLGGSRKEAVEKLKRQRLGMRAMELRDMVDQGVLTQEEADRRANHLLSQP
jgi:hypothetical protein